MIARLIFIVVIILVIYVFSFYSVLRHYLKNKTVRYFLVFCVKRMKEMYSK